MNKTKNPNSYLTNPIFLASQTQMKILQGVSLFLLSGILAIISITTNQTLTATLIFFLISATGIYNIYLVKNYTKKYNLDPNTNPKLTQNQPNPTLEKNITQSHKRNTIKLLFYFLTTVVLGYLMFISK